MNCFMTIAEIISTAKLNFQLGLISAAFAQTYIAGIKNNLEALDSSEIHVVHNMETTRSNCMVTEFDEALLNGLSVAEFGSMPAKKTPQSFVSLIGTG